MPLRRDPRFGERWFWLALVLLVAAALDDDQRGDAVSGSGMDGRADVGGDDARPNPLNMRATATASELPSWTMRG